MNAERLLAHYERIADAPDAIARLRRFILDLAVRGKLVPQDPNDEPASELLKRIAKEKARLVKAGEIRKPNASPERSRSKRRSRFPRPGDGCGLPRSASEHHAQANRRRLEDPIVPDCRLITAEHGDRTISTRSDSESRSRRAHDSPSDVVSPKIATCCSTNGRSPCSKLTSAIDAARPIAHRTSRSSSIRIYIRYVSIARTSLQRVHSRR